MWLFSSLTTIPTASVITLLLIVWAATRANPLAQLWSALAGLVREPRALTGLVMVLALLAVNKLENQTEAHLRLPWDLTDIAASLGTDLILLRDWETLRRLFTGFALNYGIALPFYLLVPVKEAWAGDAGVRFLIPTVYPAFETQYRPLSGLDNCFPSLHTSLALTFALIAWQAGYRRLAGLLTLGAGLVMLSTLYLGVHWVPDMFAGMALALVAAGVAVRPVLKPAVDARA